VITKILITIVGACFVLYNVDIVYHAMVIHGSPFSCLGDALCALGVEFSLYVMWCPQTVIRPINGHNEE
jgi:hypothetical protein